MISPLEMVPVLCSTPEPKLRQVKCETQNTADGEGEGGGAEATEKRPSGGKSGGKGKGKVQGVSWATGHSTLPFLGVDGGGDNILPFRYRCHRCRGRSPCHGPAARATGLAGSQLGASGWGLAIFVWW